LSCLHLFHITKGYLNQHLTQKSYNANLEKRVITQFIEKLDPSKLYMLEEDVKKVEGLLKDIFENTKQEKCQAILDAHKLFLNRLKERTEYAEKYLGPKFKFRPELEIVVDAKKRDYPKTKEEAEKLQEQYLHFQYATFIASGMKPEEAKSQLARRYTRSLKNLANLSTEDIYASYLDAFANALDPHSNFLSKDVLEDFEIQMRLSLEGIGATLSSQDGYTVVENVIAGGSAARSGLIEPQDKIIAVGQGENGAMEPVIDEPLRDVVRKIRGKKGTKVKLSILRQSGEKNERFSVVLERDKINLEDEAAQITYIDNEIGGEKKKIGIIDLPSFYASSKKGGRSSANDVKRLLKEAREKNVAGLVLDLSNNGGGSLDDAVKMAGLFFKTGNVVETQGSSDNIEPLADEDAAVDYNGPLVILTSRLTASASEIVAGALQDYKRAVIVGADHTFGKGSVQSVIPLPNELGALKVTVGMYFIPGGQSTQHRGVSSDMVLPGPYSTDEIGEKSLDYSLPPRKLAPFLSKEAYVPKGPDAWVQVDPEIVKKLKANSEKRVAANADFQKILKELAKAKAEKSKPLKIADVLKEKESNDKEKKDDKKKKGRLSAEEKRKEYLKRADVVEATNVLAELVALQGPAQKLVSQE
ncbi:MAG TPA: carboxy terminal-processing peptidase, partial [Bdellovibrionales bacterium]|nr:carboxy terminal-processing peptidase [Bdellovibrionales bacterium]